MKLGLGLYRNMLTRDNYRFARQAGCTHLVAHLVDYFADQVIPSADRPGDGTWGITRGGGKLWEVDELLAIKREMNQEGLEWEAIENFDPAHWYDILLDGPRKQQQLEDIKTTIRRVGEARIPIIGYNFSIAGVWGLVRRPWARGKAISVGFLGPEGPQEQPIPRGQVWNMTYDPEQIALGETVPPVTTDQLWSRLEGFLGEVLPVAEEAGVTLALHPDDPPMPTIRGHARLINQPHLYRRLFDRLPSPRNKAEFCLGTLQEMTGDRSEVDVYQAADEHSRRGEIGYVHFRNVRGKVPSYQETFVDDGDLDMIRVLQILHGNGYEGVVIPDHTPEMTCDAPWHAGMAFALGYIKAAIRCVEDGLTPAAGASGRMTPSADHNGRRTS